MIIGLDVGGTHTDVVLLGKSGLIREVKVPTDHKDLFRTVLTGLEKITAEVDPAEIERAVLSTTLTTNAIVQKKTPVVGMIVSGGPGIDPELFRTNEYYYPVGGSIDHRGRQVEPLNEYQIETIARQLADANVRFVGIVGKFSVRNPAHELKIADVLNGAFEKLFLGHQVSGNLNFPRRIATTFLNATVYPIHLEFFDAVHNSLKKRGLEIPIHILKADGGTMSFEASRAMPSQTILSGPSASVMGTLPFAGEKEEAVILDIGGTTTDIAVLVDKAPLLAPGGITLGAVKTLIRALETCSVGLGGDSRVRVADGRLSIGPERSGPAMAFGGEDPTPTDALVVLDLMSAGDRDRAVAGLTPIAEALGLGVAETAQSVFDETCRMILAAIDDMLEQVNSKPVYTIHEFKEGHRIAPRILHVLGGPAPYFAERIQALSAYQVRVVPHWKVANAIGAAMARTTCEVTLFADTEQGLATAPEENYRINVDRNFSKETAKTEALKLLEDKALQKGAEEKELETEVLEEQEFNMVRGFYTTGRNIRVRVQVKPGLIPGYEAVLKQEHPNDQRQA